MLPISRRTTLAYCGALGATTFGAATARQTAAQAGLPETVALDVETARVEFQGRAALRVRLTEGRQKLVNATPQAANGATMALLPGEFGDGAIECDIAATVNGRGDPDARGFAGVAFRVAPRGERFEAVYLRMTNGTLAQPAPSAPRNVRAVQYISHPGFHFGASRESAPGVYEKAAPVAPGRWFRYRIDVAGGRAAISIDGVPILTVPDLRLGDSARGQVGLFVDDGTDAYFANIAIRGA